MGDVLKGGDIIKCVVKSDCKSNIAYLIRIKSSYPQGLTPVSEPQGFTPVTTPQGFIAISEPQGFEDLLITPWHPVRIGGVWQYPAELKGALIEKVECEAVYSFLIFDRKKNQKNKCVHNSCNQKVNNSSSLTKKINNGNTIYENDRRNNNSNNYNKNGSINNSKNNNINQYSSTIKVNNIECAALAHGIVNEKVISHPFFGTLEVEREMRRCKGWDMGFIHFGAYERTSLLQEHKYDSSFPTMSDTLFISTSSKLSNNTDDTYESSNIDKNIITIKSTEHFNVQFVPMSVSVSVSVSESESCLIRDINTGLAKGFVLSMEL